MSELSRSQRLVAQIQFVNHWSIRVVHRVAHIAWGAGFRNPDKIPDDDPYWIKEASPWRNRLGCWFADAEQHLACWLYERRQAKHKKKIERNLKNHRTGSDSTRRKRGK